MYVQYVWNKKKPFGSSATAKISLEILKALGREKNRIWYSKANQLTATKWNEITWMQLCACLCESF